jgi:hypothetical protein
MAEQQTVTIEQAVNLLIQAAHLAQKRGAFSIDESAVLSQALNALAPSNDAGVPSQEVEEQESEKE